MTDNPAHKGMALIMAMGAKPKDGMDKSSPDDNEPDGDENYITPPRGFEPPEDAQDGGSFDITVRAHMEGDKICVESVNGMKLDSGSDQSDSDDEGGTEEEESMDEANQESNEGDESDMEQTPKSLDEAMKMQKKHSYAKQ